MKLTNVLLVIAACFMLMACDNVEYLVIDKYHAPHRIRSDKYYVTYQKIRNGHKFTSEVSEWSFYSVNVGDTVVMKGFAE